MILKRYFIYYLSGIFACLIGGNIAAAQEIGNQEIGNSVQQAALSQEILQNYIADHHMPLTIKMDYAYEQRQCLTQAIYHEARGEPDAGQWAVGEVILNRVESWRYPSSICGVIYQNAAQHHNCQFSFACDGKSDTPRLSTRLDRESWLKAALIAQIIYQKGERNLENVKVQQDVLYYHAATVAPRWASVMRVSTKIGGHIFY